MKLSKALSCLRYFSKLIFHRISSAVSISLAFSEVQQIITSSALLRSILLLFSLYKMLLKLVSFIRKSNFVITINDIFVIVGGISVQSSEFSSNRSFLFTSHYTTKVHPTLQIFYP